MNNKETAVFLINIGTPDSPEVNDVRRYLREFLGDGRVINMPWLSRKILVNFIIAPFRGPRSAKLYKAIWTKEGSPLLVNSNKLSKPLQDELGAFYSVYVAMRYGNPNLSEIIKEIASKAFKRVVLVPLYPQYADSTTGTSIAYFQKLFKKHKLSSEITIVRPFFQHPGFIESFKNKILAAKHESFDHVIFSFHGLPKSQTEKMHPGLTCQQANCRNEYNSVNTSCYNASCYETARILANASGIPESKYTVSFQSRFGKNWLVPFTDEIIELKAKQGVKSLLLVSPAFVADCLETIHELGVEYKELFIEGGGEVLHLVDSLNDDPEWVKGLSTIIKESI